MSPAVSSGRVRRDLFSQQEENRRKSSWLLIGFIGFFAWLGFGGDVALMLSTADATNGYQHRVPVIGIGITLVEEDELWHRSQLVTLHAPATPATIGAVNARRIAQMPRGAYIVNTARGALVDLDAIVDGLRNGQLAGVGLDVFEPEPLPEDHAIRSFREVILTPHAAFYSERSMENLQRLAVEPPLPGHHDVGHPGTSVETDRVQHPVGAGNELGSEPCP